jgi:hypothetical protein
MSDEARSRGRGSLLLYAFTFFVIVVIGMWGWRELSLRALRREAEARHADLTAQRDAIEASCAQALADARREQLETLALPLGWAVRDALARGEDALLEDYFLRLVKGPGILRVALVGPEGTIVRATDQKLLGERAAAFYSGLPGAGEPTIDATTPGRLRLALPLADRDGSRAILVVEAADR